MNRFIESKNEFCVFSIEHWLTLVICSLLFYLCYHYFRQKTYQKRLTDVQTFSWLVFGLYLLLLGVDYYVVGFKLNYNLPLYLCNVLCLILPVLTYFRNQNVFNVFYFLILGGTIHAVITPDLNESFPHYMYFKYWVGHLGLIWVLVCEILLMDRRPQFKGIWQAWMTLQLYTIILIGVNKVLGSNYLFLNAKPDNPSLLDYFGPWPYYILVVEFLVLPMFLLVYIPFWNRRIRT